MTGYFCPSAVVSLTVLTYSTSLELLEPCAGITPQTTTPAANHRYSIALCSRSRPSGSGPDFCLGTPGARRRLPRDRRGTYRSTTTPTTPEVPSGTPTLTIALTRRPDVDLAPSRREIRLGRRFDGSTAHHRNTGYLRIDTTLDLVRGHHLLLHPVATSSFSVPLSTGG